MAREAKPALALGDLEKAASLAHKLLAAAQGDPPGAMLEYADSVHDAHQILGLIAIQQGDVTAAEEHLILSFRIPGSITMASFGPSMTLARKLLEKGRKEAVVEYLKNCALLWDEPTCSRWVSEIEAGQIPDFGFQ